MKRVFFSLLLLTACTALLFGQYGKISGTITDSKTKEPLTGANVIVEGTRLGAVADAKGRYTILKIAPGRYSVSASIMGYAKVTQRELEVFIDRTTELNFRLTDATVQLQEVSVVAERPRIEKDQTGTSFTYNDKVITAVAAEGLKGVLDLTASFQRDPLGNYSVRGSGGYDVNFQINGVSQVSASTSPPGAFGNEKPNNSWKYDVNPIAVQQVQLISGGFTAEYGGGQAGVVKVVTKEGGKTVRGELRVEVRPSGQYHFGDYLYDQSHYEWQRWGPVEHWLNPERYPALMTNISRSTIEQQLKMDTRYANLKNSPNPADQALYQQLLDREIRWAHDVWVADHTPGDNNPLGVYDYRKGWYSRYLFGIGGPLGKDPDLLTFYFSGEYRRNPTRLPTAERTQLFQNYILNVTAMPISNHKFKITGSYQKYRGGIWSGSEDIRWSGQAFTPPGISYKYYPLIDPVRNELTVAQNFNWLWSVSDKSFLELTLAHQSEKYELPYEYLTGNVTERDRLDSLNDPRGNVLLDGIWWDTKYFRPLFNFSTNYYQDNRTENWSGAVDYTNQVSEGHMLKGGLRFGYYEMVNNGVNSSFLANTYLVRSGFAEYYKAYPIAFAGYLQDKMEFAGMVMNLGMRAEGYNYQFNIPADDFEPFYQGTGGPGEVGNPATVPSKWQFVLMPRMGVSFPIGENTAFRMQYGHFISMPVFAQAYSQRTESGWSARGNANLKPKKTINYEFGLQQMVSDKHRLDVALYYNDRFDQVGLFYVASFTGSRNRPAGFTSDNQQLYYYTTFSNNAFGSTLGMEVKFEKTTIEHWGYRISYNISQTKDGNFGKTALFPDSYRGFEDPGFTREGLSGNDRSHNLRALIQYNFGQDEGFTLFGVSPLASSVLSLTYTAQSGTPYSYGPTWQLQNVRFNRRYPLESSFDLNFVKNIELAGYRLVLGLRVMNLFNNRWLTPMDVSDDISEWVKNGITYEDPGNDPTRLGYVVADYRTWRNMPRQVFFSLGVSF